MARDFNQQHYVPQCYIKRFSDNGRISVFYRQNEEIKENQNAKKYASAHSYYNTSKAEAEELFQNLMVACPEIREKLPISAPQFLEHYFWQIEESIGPLFDAIEQDPSQLSRDECKLKLIMFFHDLAYRNPKCRSEIAKIDEITYDHLQRANLTEEEKRYVREQFGPQQARMQQLHQITDILPALRSYIWMTEEYDWYFATAENDFCFLISDDPAMQVRMSFAELCLPISSKHAIFLQKSDCKSPLTMAADLSDENWIQISARDVIKYNLLQFCASARFVFGDAENLKRVKESWTFAQKGRFSHGGQ